MEEEREGETGEVNARFTTRGGLADLMTSRQITHQGLLGYDPTVTTFT